MKRYEVTFASGAVVELHAEAFAIQINGANSMIRDIHWDSGADDASQRRLVYINPNRVEAVVELAQTEPASASTPANQTARLFAANLDRQVERARKR